jgi:hypothetical protein
MLWSQFSAIFANFRGKNGIFLKNQCYDHILHNLALFWVKNANFFAEFFGENIFKNHNIGPWLLKSKIGNVLLQPGWQMYNSILNIWLLNFQLSWCQILKDNKLFINKSISKSISQDLRFCVEAKANPKIYCLGMNDVIPKHLKIAGNRYLHRLSCNQGNQIGRIFASWFNLVSFLKITESANIFTQ